MRLCVAACNYVTLGAGLTILHTYYTTLVGTFNVCYCTRTRIMYLRLRLGEILSANLEMVFSEYEVSNVVLCYKAPSDIDYGVSQVFDVA